MAKRKAGRPRIRRVVGTQGRTGGKPVKRIYPGVTVRILGSGFGEDASLVSVWFDETRADPFTVPFSDNSLLVTAPVPETPTETLVVNVAGVDSNAVKFKVSRPRGSRSDPGEEFMEFIHAVDQYASLVGALGHRAAPAVRFPKEMRVAANYLDGSRRVIQRNVELLMQWRDRQALAAENGVPYEAIRTIERTDELIRTAGLTRQISGLTGAIFGPAGLIGRLAGESLADWLFGDDEASLLENLTSSVLEALGISIHEGVKLLEGAENLLKIFVPSGSLDGGASAGGELTIGVDVSFSPGEGVSAIAKGIDVIGQIFGEDGPSIGEQVARLEAKADGQGEQLGMIEEKADRQGEQLGMLEEKADRQGEQLGMIEEKADRQGEQLGMIEEKADRQGEQLGMIEEKADRQGEQLGMIEEKADRHEGKLDRLEGKADAQEQKLDQLEQKVDRQEGKLDRLEQKADRQEGKLDQLEQKADRQEGKLDRLEGKADRQEGKLDLLEGKADRQEEKLDRQEEKLDRLVLPVPLEGSVTTQQGGAGNLSAAVTTTRGSDNSVYIRAALDVQGTELDEEAAWSAWEPFGRPGPAFGILEVSLDLAYSEDSDDELNALLTARDQIGNIYHRAFEGQPHNEFLDPNRWTNWEVFLNQP